VRGIALALLVVAAGCGRRGAPQQRRCLELIDTLPRLEAEQRAWPRSESLACDEHGEERAREVAAIRGEMVEVCAGLAALPRALEAADEVRQCAACAPSFAPHCARARELLVDVQLALAGAGLR
jgi:hypothetical protein